MREITKEMVRKYRMKELGIDWMGYTWTKGNELSYHHLIVPKRNCRNVGLGEGYLWWNGAILKQSTSHDYLHLIESKDYDMFLAITSEMIDENIKGHLDIENLRKIRDILECFEKEHFDDVGKKGRRLIKDEYIRCRKKL